MSRPDLNLLYTLEVVLAEGNVARAARRMQLSPSAMSRALARLRETMGDPLLVRAGRNLVPTPRAVELRAQISELVQNVEAVLRPTEKLNVAKINRTFTLRTRNGFVENFGPALIARISTEAPGVQLRFLQKPDKDSAPLRNGMVDLETGVVGKTTSPELRVQALFQDRHIGVVRQGHPLCKGRMTPARYANGSHVSVLHREPNLESIDEALTLLSLERKIVTVVDDFAAAVALARSTDLIATVPGRHTTNLRAGLVSFPLPFATPGFTVSMLWHPRLDGDPAHSWLRACVREVCQSQMRT